MNPALDTLVQEFRQLVGAEAPVATAPVVAGLAEAGSPGSATPATSAAPAAPPAAPAPAAPPSPIQTPDFAQKGYHLDVTVAAGQVVESARILDRAGFCLDTITGVDWLAQNEMEVVYDYLHFSAPLRVVVRTRLPRANPEVPTILEVFPGANWHERETHDFFGIRFTGHPNLKPFLLPEDADFHPLRKDYKP
jgi:NADH-quinone oxidoreductase subunit C